MQDNLAAFLKVLDPHDNSTGGGSASAIAGAMAAALVAMVARLSIGKKGMNAESFYTGIAAEAEVLAAGLFSGARLDSEAFDRVSAAYRLPKQTPEQRTARTARIGEAMVQAALVPMENAEKCARVIALQAVLKEAFNANAASDLACAVHLAGAGRSGCLENVAINLPHIKDACLVTQLESRIAALQAA